MKILVDENIPRVTVQALHSMGHDVHDLRGTPDEGIVDTKVWELAQQQQRLLITTDKGFTQYRNEPHHGILLIRLRQPNRQKIHDRVIQAVSDFAPEEWPRLLVIVRDTIRSTSHAHE